MIKETIMDGKLVVIRGFLTKEESDMYYEEVDKIVDWTVVNKGVNGLGIKDKKGYFGRQTAVFGATQDYITKERNPIPDLLKELQLKIEAFTGERINNIYLNKYRNKDEGIGFHRDDIPGLDYELLSVISLGDTRDMVLRRKGVDEVRISLKHGDLLLKHLDLDRAGWFHSVVRSEEEVGPRISVIYANVDTDNNYDWDKDLLKIMFERQEI